MRDKLRGLDADAYMSYTINLNSKHSGPTLQPVLEAPLEKKAGASAGRLAVGAVAKQPCVGTTSRLVGLAESLHCLPPSAAQACALALPAAKSLSILWMTCELA